MNSKEFCGAISHGRCIYHVHWVRLGGMVWLSKPNDPKWGFTNVGQVQPVRKEHSMEVALEMLMNGGIS